MKLFLENVFLLSYPKAGRTWVRVLLAKLLEIMGGNSRKKELIRYRHVPPCYNGDDVAKEDISNNAIFNLRKLIILVRDPRDLVVSNYFQVTLREKGKWGFTGTMSEFIRDDTFGIGDAINFYNAWFQKMQSHPEFMFLKYEDMITDSLWELNRIVSFLNIDTIDLKQSSLREAVEYASFENMRLMDLDKTPHLLSGGIEALGSKSYASFQGKEREEAMKVRRGVVGGYVDYLDNADIEYVNERLKELHPYYGYK